MMTISVCQQDKNSEHCYRLQALACHDRFTYLIQDDSRGWIVTGEGDKPSYRFLVASDRKTRERAYRLAQEVYQSDGLLDSSPTGMVVSKFDALPGMFTILVEDAEGNAAATVSLVHDSEETGLPCDEIYSGVLSSQRKNGRRFVEVTRLAIDNKHRNSRTLLTQMINFLFIFGCKVWNATDAVIEVNPHHALYYKRMLLFTEIGSERPCPRVRGLPAVLLHQDLSLYENEVRLVGGTNGHVKSPSGRTLYSHFLAHEDEPHIADFLGQHFQPMTAEDAAYFGLSEYHGMPQIHVFPELAPHRADHTRLFADITQGPVGMIMKTLVGLAG